MVMEKTVRIIKDVDTTVDAEADVTNVDMDVAAVTIVGVDTYATTGGQI